MIKVLLKSSSPKTFDQVLCVHCGLVVPGAVQSDFCCHGCEMVYSFLNEKGLGRFYDLKKTGSIRKAMPAPGRLNDRNSSEQVTQYEDYTYLDDSEFLKLYSEVGNLTKKMEFYLEGVHCAACVWLTEKMPDLVAGVVSLRLNLGTSIATVTVTSSGSFSAVAQEFLKMGYRPHPVKRDTKDTESLQRREDRILLIRLGVAGACAGNIMLLAVSLYAGATGDLARQFKLISFFLFLPVFLFCGIPFYRSAWSSLRFKRASIDIPVVFGILVGSVVSVVRLFQGSNEIYFDTITGLVFLLLSTRYLFRKTQQSALQASHLLLFLTPSRVRKRNPETRQFTEVSANQMTPGDVVQVMAGEAIPVDGLIVGGISSISQSLLTGESAIQEVRPSDQVFAGTRNLTAPLEIQVCQYGSNSRLGKILRLVDESSEHKASLIQFADRVSRYFVLAVVIISVSVLLLGLAGSWHDLLSRALAISLVTCPCAFALATPLTFSVVLGKLARAGVLIKNSEVLEKLCQAKSVFLDKTGTITRGNLGVTEWISTGSAISSRMESSSSIKELRSVVMSLESKSNHPTAQALKRFIRDQGQESLSRSFDLAFPVENFKETLGLGVSGMIRGDFYEIYRTQSPEESTAVDIFKNGKRIAIVRFRDQIKDDSTDTIEALRKLGLDLFILSGDKKLSAELVARQVKIPISHCIAEATPEIKFNMIRLNPKSIMVGDGANDSVALAAAFVGIAVNGSVDVSMRAADIFLSDSRSHVGISLVPQIIMIANETMKVVYRNFYLSILYNLCAGGAALCGYINPLWAAILMPMSAATVAISSILGTRKMKTIFQEIAQ